MKLGACRLSDELQKSPYKDLKKLLERSQRASGDELDEVETGTR